MSCEQCREIVSHKNPPTMCSRELCSQLMPTIDKYCHDIGRPMDAPIPIMGPDGKVCWCCCGQVCGLLVATAPGSYRYLDTLRRGDTVLAGGPGHGAWAPAVVLALAVPEDAEGATSAIALAFDFPGGEVRALTLNTEMLVMLADGRLKAAGRLRNGERLRTADGREAMVRHGRAAAEAVSVPYLGPLDPSNPLAGHLLDLSGLVCADLAVSTAGFAGKLPATVLVPEPAVPPPLSAPSKSH
jgi:hypothetical protein